MIARTLDVAIETKIDRPANEVWAFVSTLERLPEWLDELEAVVKESEGAVTAPAICEP